MRKLRPEEAWAKAIIAAELAVEVNLHDDGRANGVYDLRVGPIGAPAAAIEVTGAVDGDWIAAWKASADGNGWIVDGVRGDWHVGVATTTDMRRLRSRVAEFLGALEVTGVDHVYDTFHLRRVDPLLQEQMEGLGVDSAHCYRRNGSGRVSPAFPGTGGAIDRSGEAVSGWVSEFLMDEERADILAKLPADVPERHAFLFMDLFGGPWSVVSYLTEWSAVHESPEVPTGIPELPHPVTHVWVACTAARFGVRWTGTEWKSFDARPNASGIANTSGRSSS